MPQREAWSYESVGSVGIWTLSDLEMLFEEEMEDAEEHYMETTSRPDIEAGVTVFEDDTSFSREMQEHMNDAWSQLVEAADIERMAFTADGIRAMAVKANLDVTSTDVKAFTDYDDAVEWAKRPTETVDA